MNDGRWIPSMGTDPQKHGEDNLIRRAMKHAGGFDLKPISAIYDDHGLIGLEYNDFIMVAKKYIYGWVVSAHETTIKRASREGKTIIMFIGDDDKYYEFMPNVILDKSTKNIRGGITMLNWDVKLGKRVDFNQKRLDVL